MASEYRHNHYVPVWYQKRFLSPGQADRELQYLDFQPGFFIDGRGVRHKKRAVRRQGFRFCLANLEPVSVVLLLLGGGCVCRQAHHGRTLRRPGLPGPED